MKLRTLLFLASLLVLMLPTKAAVTYQTIPLVHPELVNEDESWLEDGYVVDWREFQTPTGIMVSVNEWNPVTGQIRLDQTSGQFSSNFVFYNTGSYPGAITTIEITPSSGKLKKEDLLMTAGSFPYTFEQEAEEEGNGLIWQFDAKDDVREFRIEAIKPEKKNDQQVVVPFITVVYEGRGGRGGRYEKPTVEEPNDSIGDPNEDPIEDPEKPQPIHPQPGKGNFITRFFFGWLERIVEGLPESPGKDKVTPPAEDDKIDERIVETLHSKFLLDQLTEEELGFIRAKYGEDMEYACRNWSKDIPKIKREQSAECLEILGRMPYSDLMTFIQGIIENLMMGLADGADLWNSALGDNSHSNYEGLTDHMPLFGEDYEEFMKNPTDAGWQEFKKKADEKVPFADVVIEYDLWDYIYLNIEVEGLD